MRPMRVVMLLDSLAPGGTEQSSLVLAPRLRDHGIDVTIVTLKAAAHGLEDVAAAAGVPVVRLQPGSFVSRVRQLRTLLRRERPALLHTALFTADQVGRLAAWGTGVPVLASFVNTPYDRSRLIDPNVVRWKLRLAQALDASSGWVMVDHFHAVSEGTKTANSRALRVRNRKITVAERGRDVTALGSPGSARRSAARAALGIPDRTPIILNIGREEFQKGQLLLVEAAGRLAVDHPELVVLVAGKEGAASPAIAEALASNDLSAAVVRRLGHRTDIGDLLAAADVMVISSHFEGTAGVALEAMAMGTPIVSTDLEGLRGVLRHEGNAVLVPHGNAAALARAIARVLDDAVLAERLATAGRRDFEEKYTLPAAAERLADVYTKVVAG